MGKKTVTFKCTSAFMVGGEMINPDEFVDGIPHAEAVNLQARGKGTITDSPVREDDPAPESLELTQMTTGELKDVAENYGIKGYANMKKATLIEAIQEHEGD
jgi:hypothetical protein